MASTVANTLRSILIPGSGLSNELSTALISLGTAVDQLQKRQDASDKELELVRKMARTNWLMVKLTFNKR